MITAHKSGAWGGLRSWLMTTNHEQIGRSYFLGTIVAFLMAAVVAAIMQIAHVKPQMRIVSAATYGQLFTWHGTMMIFLFAIPALPALLGNVVLPRMLGANKVALPRVNRAGFWLYMAGAVLAIIGLVLGKYDAGWTMLAPASSIERVPLLLLLSGFLILAVSTIFLSVNIIVTVHRCRPVALPWSRLPALVWTLYLTAFVYLIIMAERVFMLCLMIADQSLQTAFVTDALVYQHLVWFSTGPAAYITILPVIGVISEILQTFARRQLFALSGVITSCCLLAFLSLIVWGQHMFVSDQAQTTTLLFSFLSLLLVIPSTFIIGSWLATLFGRKIELRPPMLFALGSIMLFAIGGLAGAMLSVAVVNVQLHDTYFVVGHLHYAMLGGLLFGFLAALHYWWPLFWTRQYSERWAAWGAYSLFVSINLICLPFFILGRGGVIRHTASYPEQFQLLHAISAVGVGLLIVSISVVVTTLWRAFRRGEPAAANPWSAVGPDFDPNFRWTQKEHGHDVDLSNNHGSLGTAYGDGR